MATLVEALQSPIGTIEVALAAGNSTKTLIGAPPAGIRIRIFKILYISKTSAAQTLAVAAGATNVLDLAENVIAHSVVDTGWLEGGLLMPAATALVATPGAAGPAGSFFVTYRVE